MPRQTVSFQNERGQTLAGSLSLPDNGPPKAMALFAHCFTCGKDVLAASRIADSLAERGIGVLRFDFTGLGESGGDFSETSFTSNISDLSAAADFLADNGGAPKLIIGHSLGGAAALVAADRIESVEAVVTIGAPASPAHVQHLFANRACDIRAEGEAEVDIGGRPFNVGAPLLEDLEAWQLKDLRTARDKPLLIFHSPVDKVVGIDQAAAIYEASRHPKSFISLDDADHLLSRREDAEYVAEVLSAWAGRYL